MHDQQQSAHELLGRIQELLENSTNKSNHSLDNKIIEGIVQLYAIGTGIEDSRKDNDIDADDISQIGEYGFNLLTELLQWAHNNEHANIKSITRELILSLTLWVVTNKGELQTLEPVVDAVAHIANQTKDIDDLKEIVVLMTKFIGSCSSLIKNDQENINPMRPWRVLHLNRAITATRSHDVILIRNVFQELVTTLPYDAADLFTEGMHEMDRLHYPDAVKEVVQEFFNKYSRPKMN